MTATKELRAALKALLSALRQCDFELHAEGAAKALKGTDRALRAYLLSNELWGGAGSLADQANGPVRRALVDLGLAQIAAGCGSRAELWTEATAREVHGWRAALKLLYDAKQKSSRRRGAKVHRLTNG